MSRSVQTVRSLTRVHHRSERTVIGNDVREWGAALWLGIGEKFYRRPAKGKLLSLTNVARTDQSSELCCSDMRLAALTSSDRSDIGLPDASPYASSSSNQEIHVGEKH